MGRTNKKTIEKPKLDTFDVKLNLKKLGSSINRNSYMGNGTTEEDYTSEQKSSETISSYQDSGFNTNFEIYRLKQDKKISNDLSSLKDAVHIKINQDVKEVKKEIEEKINNFELKLENTINKYIFGGVIAFAIILVTIIYVLSYQPALEKITKNSEDNIIIKDTLKSIQFDIKHRKH